MIEIKKEDPLFLSKDNKVFTDKEKCIKHENDLKKDERITIITRTIALGIVLYMLYLQYYPIQN